MPEFMIRALDLIPQPAALFEADTNELIGVNNEGVELVNFYLDKVSACGSEQDQFRARRARGDIAKHGLGGMLANSSFAKILTAGAQSRGIHTVARDFGIIHVSRLRAARSHQRPDLLLASVHVGTDSWTSVMDHHRLVVALYLNEMSAISSKMLDHAQQQLAAALDVQDELVDFFNGRVAEFMESNRSEVVQKIVKEPIDISRRDATGYRHRRQEPAQSQRQEPWLTQI